MSRRIKKLISPNLHGIIDYIASLSLILIPLKNGYSGIGLLLPFVLGVIALIYTVLTDYHFGFKALIPLGVHLAIDLFGGLLLVFSALVFGLEPAAQSFHLQFGLGVLLVVALTDTSK